MTDVSDGIRKVVTPPTEVEVADLMSATSIEPFHSILRRLIFQRDRLISAIDGKDGWREECERLRKIIRDAEAAI